MTLINWDRKDRTNLNIDRVNEYYHLPYLMLLSVHVTLLLIDRVIQFMVVTK